MTAPTTDQTASPSIQPTPSPAGSPRPSVIVSGLTMGQQTRLTPTTTPAPPAAWPAAPVELADPVGDEPPASTATRSASSGVALGRPELRELARNMIAAAGEAANLRFAGDGLERESGLYATTAGEAKGTGEPLADIVHRRIGGDGLSPDALDLIRAGVVLASYVLRTVNLKLSLWRAARSLRRPDLPEHPDNQETTA